MEKRSLSLAGHRTSVALEPEFWAAAEKLAGSREISLASLIIEIDAQRGDRNLASAIRVALLAAGQSDRGQADRSDAE